MNLPLAYTLALSLVLFTSPQAVAFEFDAPPPAQTVLRDDLARVLPEVPLIIDVLDNDTGIRSGDSLRLLGSIACGRLSIKDINARSVVEYQADSTCAGQVIEQQYSLTRASVELEASATIILRVADNPVEPEQEAPIASPVCPNIPGVDFIHIDSQLLKPYILSSMTDTEPLVELAPGHIATVLAAGAEIYEHTEVNIPAAQSIAEFCLMTQQVQSTDSYSYNQIIADLNELETPDGWQLSPPNLWELLAASMHLFSHQDQQLYRAYMRSLRDLDLEWAQNTDNICPEASSLILGPEQTRIDSPRPFHAYCQRQDYRSTSNNYGYRLVARKINPQ